MKMKWMMGITLAASLGTAACSTSDPGAPDDKGSLDIGAVMADGKSDIGRKAKLLDELSPNSRVQGTFDRRVRVYGYVVEASRGAKLNISIGAAAGSDIDYLEEGEELDTILAVYGPYENRRNPGELLVEVDDTDDGFAAPPVSLDVEQDGRYLIAFSSWDDTGDTSTYDVNIECDGTDYQCRRPQFERPCEAGQLFIQGTTSLAEDTEWSQCEVVLLENAVVGPEAILTIRPGVEVKSNYLAGPNNLGNHGVVGLDVQGTLQAVGTAEHPIRFTSLTDRGWRGLTLRGPSNAIQHAFIDNAGVGVELTTTASAEIADVVIEGNINGDNEPDVRGTDGILAHTASNAVFKRATVKNFSNAGFHSQGGDHVLIEDSVLHSNNFGVLVTGEDHSRSCRTRVNTPPVWRDPVIRHSDIYKNEWGIMVRGSDELLQVEKSNIVDNTREALTVEGTTLHEDSYIRESNILRNSGNRGSQQVLSYHRSGTLDVSQNYWEDISDPELSANWRSACSGNLAFTGFHPMEIDDAGPRLETLVDDVKQETLEVLQQDAPDLDE